MMSDNDPLAYFLTWTVYGTFLQGDRRWWRKRGSGSRPPQPLLERWHRERLKHEIILLNQSHRDIVKRAIQRHCEFRGWKLWEANPRSNHVHVVVTANGYSGKKVRDQLKANATRELRQQYAVFIDRPVWSVGGDWKCINSENALERAILYAGEGQEKMDRKDRK